MSSSSDRRVHGSLTATVHGAAAHVPVPARCDRHMPTYMPTYTLIGVRVHPAICHMPLHVQIFVSSLERSFAFIHMHGGVCLYMKLGSAYLHIRMVYIVHIVPSCTSLKMLIVMSHSRLLHSSQGVVLGYGADDRRWERFESMGV